MRRFAEPTVLLKAAGAAALGTGLCLPRLAMWQKLHDSLWFVAAMLAWCLFVLWGFVFAWEPIHGKAVPLKLTPEPAKWALILPTGAVFGLFLHYVTDAPLRGLFPNDFPTSVPNWFAHMLFNLAFVELFLCYAPLAFFARLCPYSTWVVSLTIAVNLLILAVKLGSVPTLPPSTIVFALGVYRVLVTLIAIWLYRWSGVAAVSALVLTVQARLLFTLTE